MCKKQIIDIYEKIILEYFEKIELTEFIKYQEKENIISTGLNTLIHIFRISLSKYKNVEIAYHYCKQGYFYYLEYIKQIAVPDLQQNLNCNDAILFVYSKTLPAIEELTQFQSVEYLAMDQISGILKNIAIITNILLGWNVYEITHSIRGSIIDQFLSKYLFLFLEESNEKYLNCLIVLNESGIIHKNPIEVLNTFYKMIKKNKKNHTEEEVMHNILQWKALENVDRHMSKFMD